MLQALRRVPGAAVATALTLLGSVGAAADGPPATAQSPWQLVVEKDCFGCPRSERFTVDHSGQVVLERLGKARHRTADERWGGQLAAADLARLERLWRAIGFAQLKPLYDSTDSADGAWVQAALSLGPQAEPKRVFRREGFGPSSLVQLEAEVETTVRRAARDRLP